MDSHPYQRNQMPFPHCYYTGNEAIPPHLRMDLSKSPFAYEQPWSYGYPTPVHFCCAHNNFPGYYNYRPAYPHAPAPSPVYFSGGGPAYGEPFPVPYSPQPHYTMELPRYEYDRCIPRDYHCCGCPNHPCYQKEDKGVKIEEQESDVGKKANDALVPIQVKNYPYPFVWIPPEYASHREQKNRVTAEVGDQDITAHDRKPPGPLRADAQEPRVWNGWLPFEMNSAPNMINDGDGRNQNGQTDNNRRESENGIITQKRHSEPKRAEFPFLIIWMPYFNKREEGGRENNQESTSTPKIIEEVPHSFKCVPVNFYTGEGVINGTRPIQYEPANASGSSVTEKVADDKSIPVKQIEVQQGENDSVGGDRRERNIPVKQMEENMTEKDYHTGAERQSMSPQKASKLPSVCLRVDPLPGKKNGKGSSRSPSPPASKEHPQETARKTCRTPSCGMNDNSVPDSDLQNASNTSVKIKPKERTVQMFEKMTSEKKGSDCRDGSFCQISSNMASGVSAVTKESCVIGDECKIEENKAENKAENIMKEEVSDPREVRVSSKPTEKVLSDVHAAVLMQAAYRGFQVRKWEPLKKLRQIAEVRREVTDVIGRIQALEASSDLWNDDKQTIIIGEIMRLLLKWDNIQDQVCVKDDGIQSLPTDDGRSACQSLVDPASKKVTEPIVLPNGIVNEDVCRADTVDACNSATGHSETDKTAVERETKSEVVVDDSDITAWKELPVGVIDEDLVDINTGKNEQNETGRAEAQVTGFTTTLLNRNLPAMVDDSARDGVNSQIHATMELPVGLLDKDTATSEFEENDETKTANRVLQADDGQCTAEMPAGVLDEDTTTSEFENHGATEISEGVLRAGKGGYLAELPVQLPDEDKAASEFEKQCETKISNEVLSAGEGGCNLNVKSSPIVDPSKEIQLEEQQLEEQEVEQPSLTNEDGCLEANDENNIQAEPQESGTNSQPLVPINDVEKEEELVEKGIIAERAIGAYAKDTQILANEKNELSAASPADKELPVSEHDGGLSGDTKSLEENEMLRKMLEKLLEAVSEQLTVISDFTDRVMAWRRN